MTSPAPRDLAGLERYSRRSLWAVLFLLVLVGVIALSPLGAQPWARTLVPLSIVVTVIVLRGFARSAGANSKTMQPVLDDELRRQSLARACRDALLAVMALQPVLAVIVTQWPLGDAAVVMALTTVAFGLVALISSLLIRDR